MITAQLNELVLPMLEQPFIQTPIEKATDVEVLNGDVYTDFTAQNKKWEMGWASLTEDEYEAIRAIYDAQFTSLQYPTLTIPYYSVDHVPVRMYINDKDIWNNCGSIQGVQITLRETGQLPETS